MNRLVIAVALMLSLTAWTPSTPPGTATLFSQSFEFTGACTGGEMVYSWTIGRGPDQGDHFIHPWLPFDITIRGVSLVTNAAPLMFWMVGNNADGDAMAFMAKNEFRVMNWFPSGAGFAFPGTKDQDKNDYIDLHGACAKGPADLILTLYYSRN